MVGESVPRNQPRAAAGRGAAGARTTLAVDGMSMPGLLDDVSFEVAAGEIVGLAGLAGSGRSELLEALFGVRQATGTVELDGEPFDPASPRASIAAGIGYLPPDRKTQALNLAMSVGDNLTAIQTLTRSRIAMPRTGTERAAATSTAAAMGVKAASLDTPVGSLSGGNQQKVALGRWVAVKRRLLLLDEPTRGVDVAAKWEIHARLGELAADGLALLVSSSENDELLELCDRILVFFRGRVVAGMSAKDASEAGLARLAGGDR
jgi:ABC-type sugar transport system ATPase subunit